VPSCNDLWRLTNSSSICSTRWYDMPGPSSIPAATALRSLLENLAAARLIAKLRGIGYGLLPSMMPRKAWPVKGAVGG